MAEDFQAKYDRLYRQHERLRDEIRFSLDDAFGEAGIRTHAVIARVKTAESLATKARDKGWGDPFESASDVVAARVVVLFASDVAPARRVIQNLFDVIKEEEVGTSQPNSFGYSGIHIDAQIPKSDTGRRYRGLHDLTFEVQLRTIVEDAWAAVSHVLGYKGAASIPDHLQRDFYALSGLFYVADRHFEMFYNQAARSQKAAERNAASKSHRHRRLDQVPFNADTVMAFLNQRYPERRPASRAASAELLPDLEMSGVVSMMDLATMLDRTQEMFQAYERSHPPGDMTTVFGPVGVARLSLAIANSEFRSARYYSDDPLHDFALD